MGRVFSRPRWLYWPVRPRSQPPPPSSPSETNDNEQHPPAPKVIVYGSEEDNRRLKSNHESYKEILNGNFQSPVHETLKSAGSQVLDIGSGQGVWLLEMAKDYPEANFTGIDIDPKLFPKRYPCNCNFIGGDAIKGLPFPDGKFDFVFSRLMVMSFTRSQWSTLTAELVRVTKPGGFIELIEPDLECLHMGPQYERWNHEVLALLCEKNFVPNIGRSIGYLLDDIPSVTLTKSDSAVSEKIGFKEDVSGFFKAMKPALLGRLNMTSEEYDQYSMICIKECDDYESFLNVHYAFGRKDSEMDKYSTVSSRGI